MKYLLIILLFPFVLLAQTNYYVTSTGAGNYTGLDWDNAWSPVDSAFTNSNGINSAILTSGDTLFFEGINGGSQYDNFSLGSYQESTDYDWHGVVITPSTETGHDGTVYFVRKSNGGYGFKLSMRSGAKIVGDTSAYSNVGSLVITDSASAPTNSLVFFGESDWGDLDSNYVLEGARVYHHKSIGFTFVSKVTVTKSIVTSEGNVAGDVDVFTSNYGRGGHTISYCKIYNNNYNVGTDSHRDVVQFSFIGLGNLLGGTYATEVLTTTFANNLVYLGGAEGTTWNAILYYPWTECNHIFLVYNNIIVSEKIQTSYTTAWIGTGEKGIYSRSLYELNNTFIMKGAGYSHGTHTGSNNTTTLVDSNANWATDKLITLQIVNNSDGDGSYGYITDNDGTTATAGTLTCWETCEGDWDNGDVYILPNSAPAFNHYNIDTVVIKNNIVVIDTFTHQTVLIDSPDSVAIDYNIYAHYNGASAQGYQQAGNSFLSASAYYTFQGWQNLGYDVNGDTVNSQNVTFVNKYGVDIDDYYTTTGRGDGGNLWDEFPFLRTDILGNARPETGAWDIGALQYIEGGVDPPTPISGGWLKQPNGRGIFFPNGRAFITSD